MRGAIVEFSEKQVRKMFKEIYTVLIAMLGASSLALAEDQLKVGMIAQFERT